MTNECCGMERARWARWLRASHGGGLLLQSAVLAAVLLTTPASPPARAAGSDLRIEASYGPDLSWFELNWNSLGADYLYVVERCETLAAGAWEPAPAVAGPWPSAATHWHESAPTRVPHRFYRVRAEAWTTTPVPGDVQVAAEDGTLRVWWSPVPLATAFLVHWSTNQPFALDQVTVVLRNEPEFVLAEAVPGIEYGFVVQAVGHLGTSPFSPLVRATAFPVAPPFRILTLGDATAFLYSGSNAPQRGVAPGTIDPRRVAIVRSAVRQRDGRPLGGVAVRVVKRPEFGVTETRPDGTFDLAVNGGAPVTVEWRKPGFLPVHRRVPTRWQQYAPAPEVVLTPLDPVVTPVRLGTTPGMQTLPGMQVARGTAVIDRDGRRQATLLVTPGATAELVLADGRRQGMASLGLRATEFTVGPEGPRAMPAELPPEVAYTYCVELSADEALDLEAREVRFDRPLAFYTDNFLRFPVGGIVPVGYYDRAEARWVASPNGRILAVLGTREGRAELDVDGSGVAAGPAALAALGISDDEQRTLATLYAPGQSLWRVPITHFTPWDCNWPTAPPEDAEPPELPWLKPPPDPDDPCDPPRPIVEYQTQVLGERLGLVGVPATLNYRSDRVPGAAGGELAEIPLSLGQVPRSLKRIELEVLLAGRRITEVFPPQPNLTHRLSWDGRDVYGRSVAGTLLTQVRVGYAYDVVYVAPGETVASFGRFGGAPLSMEPARTEFTLWQEWTLELGRRRWDARIQGLGGWTLSPHHVYDPVGRTLYLGDGTRRGTGTEFLPQTVRTVAGGGALTGSAAEGQPATEARLAWPLDIAVGPDGSVFIADTDNYRVCQVLPDGTLRTLAGNGTLVSSGDGGPAVLAGLDPIAVAVGPDGSLYVTDLADSQPPVHQVPQQGRIRRITPDGMITTVAGPGNRGQLGDDGPARDAFLWYPTFLCAAPDGSLYVADSRNDRIRRIDPDGAIRTVAGGGEIAPGQLGDGGSALSARLSLPYGIALGPDGSLYIADSGHFRIRRVTAAGLITTYAGSGDPGYRGDGGPAREAGLGYLSGLALGWDGSLYFPDTDSATAAAIYLRRISPDGFVSRVAGGGAPDDGIGEGLRAFQVGFWKMNALAIGPDGTLFICDSGNDRVRRLQPVLPGLASADFYVPAEDGREVYLFDPGGRHLRTLHALTGAVLHRFDYDAAGRLITLTDGGGNVTRLERGADGVPVAIVGPFGHRTGLGMNEAGFLARVINPAGETVTLEYETGGLLSRLTEGRGHAYLYQYGPDGRLTGYRDPDGGGETLSRQEDTTNRWVVARTAQGRVTTFTESAQADGGQSRGRVDPCGAESRLQITPDGARDLLGPDGTRQRLSVQPDPRFGLRAPIPEVIETISPAGRKWVSRREQMVELEEDGDPLHLRELVATTVVNGQAHRLSYTAGTSTFAGESPEGREVIGQLDALGRPLELQRDPAALEVIRWSYTPRGLLERLTAGDWSQEYTRDTWGRVTELRDAAGRRFEFEYDAADRVLGRRLPSGRTFAYRYDASGNLTHQILPDGKVRRTEFSGTGAPLAYHPPAGGTYRRTYLPDHGINDVQYPDGRRLEYRYDACGRLASLTSAEGVVGFEYDGSGQGCCGEQGRVVHIRRAPTDPGTPAQDVQLAHDGPLLTRMTFSGFAAGTFQYDYNDAFLLTSITHGQDAPVRWEYDDDGLPVRQGPFTLLRDGPAGALSGVTDDVLEMDLEYDGLGRTVARRFQWEGEEFYACERTFGAAGFVTDQTEYRGGEAETAVFELDPDGLLLGVEVDGERVESSAYDLNGNRITQDGVAAVYDARDCLGQRGAVVYTFDTNGCLSGRGTDRFEYGLRGELLRATVAGQTLRYVYDGLGRRVGRIAPEGTTRYLYGNPAQPFQITVLLDRQGVATRCFYDEEGLLFALERGAFRYYVATDLQGTPALVVRSDGEIVRSLRHDRHGRVLADTRPDFELPVDFAGGLPDPGTGLVRFGWRDYEPESGRWTTPDPILHDSPDPSPYLYANGNPLTFRDPFGLFCVSGSAYAGVGGGGSVCFGDGGASACVELGVGVGAGAGISTGGPSAGGTSFGAEVSASMGLFGGSLSGSINECGKASVDASASVGPSKDARTFGKVGVSAKVTVTHCWRLY